MKDNAMNLTEARHLLSITERDDLHTLKKKYHRLMSECHPDALGSERPVFTGEVNERAFRERKVYLYYSMEVEEAHPYYQAAKVKMQIRDGKVDLYFRLEQTAETYRIPNRNLQIAE